MRIVRIRHSTLATMRTHMGPVFGDGPLLLRTDPHQALFEPVCKFIITSLSLGDTCYGICYDHIVFDKFVAASHRQ